MMVSAKQSEGIAKQSKREIAYSDLFAQHRWANGRSFRRVKDVPGLSSNGRGAFSLYRYPSPGRPAYSPSRPMTVSCRKSTHSCSDIGYHAEIAIDRSEVCTNRGATYETMIGLRLCKRHQSSLRQWQYLVWQVALRATQSVALQVQALALWPQKSWVRTGQAPCLPVLPLVCCATTQASTAAVKLDNRARQGRAINTNRRRGHAPAAVLRFGDER